MLRAVVVLVVLFLLGWLLVASSQTKAVPTLAPTPTCTVSALTTTC